MDLDCSSYFLELVGQLEISKHFAMDGNDLDTSQVDVPGSLWTQINLQEALQMKDTAWVQACLGGLVYMETQLKTHPPNFKIGLGSLKMKNKGRSVLINDSTFGTTRFRCSTATKHFEVLQTCKPCNKKHNIAMKSTEKHHQSTKFHHSHLQSSSTSIVDQSNLLDAITRCHALPKSHVKRYNCHHPDSISPGRRPPRCIKITPPGWNKQKPRCSLKRLEVFFGDKGWFLNFLDDSGWSSICSKGKEKNLEVSPEANRLLTSLLARLHASWSIRSYQPWPQGVCFGVFVKGKKKHVKNRLVGR